LNFSFSSTNKTHTLSRTSENSRMKSHCRHILHSHLSPHSHLSKDVISSPSQNPHHPTTTTTSPSSSFNLLHSLIPIPCHDGSFSSSSSSPSTSSTPQQDQQQPQNNLDQHKLSHVLKYHNQTKHNFNQYARGPHGLDWANQPNPFRRYLSSE